MLAVKPSVSHALRAWAYGRRRLAKRTLLLVGAAAIGLQVFYFLPNHWSMTEIAHQDFVVYRRAALAVRSGGTLYDDCLPYDRNLPPACYLYPPALAVVLSHAAPLDERGFQRTWFVLLVLAHWAFAAGLIRLALDRLTLESWVLVNLLVLLTPGMGGSLSFGNADVVVYALCAWGLSAPSFRPALAVAGAMKPYALVALLVLCWRDRRAILPSVGVAVGLLLLVVKGAGWENLGDWWSNAGGVLAQGNWTHSNVSLSMAPLRVARAALGADWTHDLPPGARAFLALAQIGVPGIVALKLRTAPPVVQAAAVLTTFVAAAPFCWWYYLPLGLLPAAVLVRERRQRSPQARALEVLRDAGGP